jgi:hypothetical protein
MKEVKRILVAIQILLIAMTTSNAQSNSDIYWGYFEEGLHNNLTIIQQRTAQLGKKPAQILWYTAWNSASDIIFPISESTNLFNNGYMPHIVIEPSMSLIEIASGIYDEGLTNYGKSIKAYGKPVMLRWAHEMNGDWYPWSKFTPAQYIEAFRHVHDKIEEASGGNLALWIWAPNHFNGGSNANDMTTYYPGDAYVDWIGIDGYNWGTSQSWSSWKNFNDAFSSAYNKLSEAYPKKPIMISEFGCSSTGGNKALWIDDFFVQIINNFPKIKSFVWFNINKETDWRFDSDASSLTAYKNGINNKAISGDHLELSKYVLKGSH